MRRTVKIIILLLSVLSGMYLFCFRGDAVGYTQCIMNGQQYQEIMDSREEQECLLDGLVFGEEDLFFDRSSDTFYYSMIEGDPRAMDPGIVFCSEYEGLQLAFPEYAFTDESIQNAQETELLAYTEDYYYVYHLVCTTLPLMNIDCPEEIGDDPAEMAITVFDNRRQEAERVKRSAGEIHIRGGSTRYTAKRSYRLSLTAENPQGEIQKNQISLLGLRRDDDWILYSAYTDQEKIRNVFCSNLWEYTCTGTAGIRKNCIKELIWITRWISICI